jgi:hypothetical protein
MNPRLNGTTRAPHRSSQITKQKKPKNKNIKTHKKIKKNPNPRTKNPSISSPKL